MAIKTLEDVIEEICDVAGIYGAHGDPEDGSTERDEEPCTGPLRKQCRVCATAYLREQIEAAVEVETLLGRR